MPKTGGATTMAAKGLAVKNTLAELKCSAAIGTLVGAGERGMPALAALTVVLANVVLREVAEWIDKRHAANGTKQGATTGQ